MERLHDGFGDKMATFIQWFSTIVCGYTLGFAVEWRLALAVLSVCPILVLSIAIAGQVGNATSVVPALHRIALRYIALLYIALHCIT